MAEITGNPIGYLTVLRFRDGTYDPDADVSGLWPTPEEAAEEAADPEMAGRLNEGERWDVAAVVPLEEPR